MSNSFWPRLHTELQYARLPCLLPTPRACSNSCPSSWWCYSTTSSSSHPNLSSSFSSCLQSFPESGSFSVNMAICIRWPKYWSFSFPIRFSNEYSGLVSFKIDWPDLFAVQGTLKSLLQHQSSKTLVLQCSAFFVVQHLYPYVTPGKTIALTIGTFVSKLMSLLFNMLSVFVKLFFQGASVF